MAPGHNSMLAISVGMLSAKLFSVISFVPNYHVNRSVNSSPFLGVTVSTRPWGSLFIFFWSDTIITLITIFPSSFLLHLCWENFPEPVLCSTVFSSQCQAWKPSTMCLWDLFVLRHTTKRTQHAPSPHSPRETKCPFVLSCPAVSL